METNKWYTSKEAKSLLKISDCKLMHLRLEGIIVYKKNGRGFLYNIKK
jgi:hypothetical protein